MAGAITGRSLKSLIRREASSVSWVAPWPTVAFSRLLHAHLRSRTPWMAEADPAGADPEHRPDAECEALYPVHVGNIADRARCQTPRRETGQCPRARDAFDLHPEGVHVLSIERPCDTRYRLWSGLTMSHRPDARVVRPPPRPSTTAVADDDDRRHAQHTHMMAAARSDGRRGPPPVVATVTVVVAGGVGAVGGVGGNERAGRG